ncbi:hypothetical protein G173_gp094 [Erwinia phage phiEaH2]|uniref:YdgH/BhsA/McbA-like domain-containing protein n=1 Tax=Erwinia phage phiEaH2 TaxID=1029988 RepID=J7KE04_9CAUD|nr:hypothetical protein G173_gp094 [Erwinia phage phiEaH2]AFQ96639.1 hypothetical protein [Erwinia phage phiEaH2]
MSIKEIASNEDVPANYKKIGNVTATGSTVDDVTAKLAVEAEKAGGDAFKVIGISGNNQQHGSAIVYKAE